MRTSAFPRYLGLTGYSKLTPRLINVWVRIGSNRGITLHYPATKWLYIQYIYIAKKNHQQLRAPGWIICASPHHIHKSVPSNPSLIATGDCAPTSSFIATQLLLDIICTKIRLDLWFMVSILYLMDYQPTAGEVRHLVPF